MPSTADVLATYYLYFYILVSFLFLHFVYYSWIVIKTYFDVAGTTEETPSWQLCDVIDICTIHISELFLKNDRTSWLNIQTTVFRRLHVSWVTLASLAFQFRLISCCASIKSLDIVLTDCGFHGQKSNQPIKSWLVKLRMGTSSSCSRTWNYIH